MSSNKKMAAEIDEVVRQAQRDRMDDALAERED